VSAEPIAVAMSGGLDSSVAAWLLSRDGPALGLSMLLWDRSSEGGSGRCCGALDLGDARRVAAQCGMPHYTLRMEEEFRRYVVDPFVDSYLAGRTPVPCTSCNTWLKFDLFLSRARGLGARRMATGHYARIVEGEDGPELHRAAREEKDQSYYLFELTQEQLSQSLFPLGDRSKDEVRALARQAGLVTAEKGESMELCFVAGGVREFIETEVRANPQRFGEPTLGRASELVASDGSALGRGEPTYRYTVGQRRGLGVAAGRPLYVLEVRPERNQIVVGAESGLLAGGLEGSRLHWIGRREADRRRLEATVRIRSRHEGVAALIEPLGEGRARVEFAEPQRGVTPGQAAVFYDASRVLGGCWIDRGLGCE
jgi:tRNA-specific 2-thiouridylase